MMMNRFTKSLKNALTLNFILIAILPILLISFFTLKLLNDKISQQIIEKNHIVADSLAAETQDFLIMADRVSQQAADGVEYIGIDNQELVQHYLELIIKNFSDFNSIQVIDEQGIVIMMAPANSDYIGNSIVGSRYYKKVGDTKQPSWSTTFLSPMTGQPTITLVRPLQQGMIVANLNLGALNRIVAHANTLADGWAGIIDTEGTYIGHTMIGEVNRQTNVRQFDYVKNALNGKSGNYQQVDNGANYLISAAVVKPIGWSVIVGQNADSALVSLQTARSIFMMGAFIALIVALIVAIWLLGKILQPLLTLVKNMQAVAAGKYQVTAGLEDYEELTVLSQNFGHMAEAVASREKALKDNEAKLEISLRNLEISNRELDQFAYVASHDLKAPLRAIMNLSQWLEEDLAGCIDESAKEKLVLLRSRALRMENLIIGVLEYSRIGKVKNKIELVDIQQLLEDIIDDLSCTPPFRIVIGPCMPIIMANRIQLWQIFSNLISNAVKHHDKQEGLIHITAAEQEDFYEFSVADDGPGIAAEQQQKVFQMFQTLRPRDQFESTGIGLALVKKSIQQQGGSIWMQSEQGQGATFIFTWPKRVN